DLKSHRDRIDHDITDARLDQQVGDQLSLTKEPDPRASLRSLEAQILAARQQLDLLIESQGWVADVPVASYRQPYQVHKDAYGRTRISYDDAAPRRAPELSNLPQTLRDMQRDLH